MCGFFSCVSDGNGKVFYFDHKIRSKILMEQMDYYSDSHTSIADWFGFEGKKEDTLNKYEYNPLTKFFKVDQLNTKDDSEKVKSFCKKLDFKSIVPELIIKPIINPFQIVTKLSETEYRRYLKEWASVRTSVEDSAWDSAWEFVWKLIGTSVGDSVRETIWNSVGNPAWDSIWNSILDSVWDSVWDSIRASIENSLWTSVRVSIGDSIAAYISSFFNIKNNFDHSSAIKLWENGVVPSFDGNIWRLHTKDGIIFEIEKDKLYL